MARIVLVTKDKGAFGAVGPLAVCIREHGKHESIVVAEGLSVFQWKDAGFDLYFEGAKDFRVEPFECDPRAILKEISPTAVVVGTSSPMNLEDGFAVAANALEIPLIFAEDFWGAHNRHFTEPTAILTLDDYAATLAKKNHPAAGVYVVGNHGMPINFTTPPEFQNWMGVLREQFNYVVAFVSGRTFDDLSLCIESIKKTPDSCLIPCFHPKRVDENVEGKTRGDIWWHMLAESGLGPRIIEQGDRKTDHIVTEAHITCSGFSTMLTTAAAAGKIAVSLRTPEVLKIVEEQVTTQWLARSPR